MPYTVGYKVVRKKGRYLESCYAPEEGITRYKLGTWTERKENFGALAVFDDVWVAGAFLLTHDDPLLLYRCHFIKSKEGLFTKIGRKKKKLRSVPIGTVFAERVKLTRRIYIDALYSR